MRKVIIGVTGKAGSGKDTVADYLVDKFEFTKLAMADPLKDGIKHMFLLDDETVYDRVKREEPLKDFPDWSTRKLMQYIGTELLREQFDYDIWIKLMMKRIRMSDNNRFVISDIRFPNELELIRKSGFDYLIFRVEREDKDVGETVGIANHASESYDLPYDHLIDNNGTLEQLYERVEHIIINKTY